MRVQIRIPDSDVSVYFPVELLVNRESKTAEDLIKQRREELDKYERELKSKQKNFDDVRTSMRPSRYDESMDQILTRLEVCKKEQEALTLLENKMGKPLDWGYYDPFTSISVSQISLSIEELDAWREDESLEEKLAKIKDVEISFDKLVQEVRHAIYDKKPLPVVNDPNIVQQIVSSFQEGGESIEPVVPRQKTFKKTTHGKRVIQEIIETIRTKTQHTTREHKEKVGVITAVLEKESKLKEIKKIMSQLGISSSEQEKIRQAHLDADKKVKALASKMSDKMQPSKDNEDINTLYVELDALSGFEGRDDTKLRREFLELIEAEASVANSDLGSDSDLNSDLDSDSMIDLDSDMDLNSEDNFNPETYLSPPREIEFSESAKRLRDTCVQLLTSETLFSNTDLPFDQPLSFSQRLELVNNAIENAEPELGKLESVWLFFKQVGAVISNLISILRSDDSTQELNQITSEVAKSYKATKIETKRNEGLRFLKSQRNWHLENEGHKYSEQISDLLSENQGKKAEDLLGQVAPSIRNANPDLEERLIKYRAERQMQVDEYEKKLDAFINGNIEPQEIQSYLETAIPADLRADNPQLEGRVTAYIAETKKQQAEKRNQEEDQKVNEYKSRLSEFIKESKIYRALKLLHSISPDVLDRHQDLKKMVTKKQISWISGEQLASQLLEGVAKGKMEEIKEILTDIPAEVLKEYPNLLLGLLTYKGPLTDDAGRQFDSISPFQYALWAKDTAMIDVLLNAIPKNEEGERIKHALLQQYDELESRGVDYTFDNNRIENEKHFDLTPLQEALLVCTVEGSAWKDGSQLTKYWGETVGEEQRRLPAHIVNAYCRGSDGSLFLDKSTTDYQSRFKNRETGEWVVWWSKNEGYELGKNLGVVLGKHKGGRGGSLSDPGSEDMHKMETSLKSDRSSLKALDRMRTKEIKEIKSRLQPEEPAPETAPRMK